MAFSSKLKKASGMQAQGKSRFKERPPKLATKDCTNVGSPAITLSGFMAWLNQAYRLLAVRCVLFEA